MKIISSNADYFLGFDGSFLKYLLYSRRAVRANGNSEIDDMEELKEIVKEEEPDLVTLQEVDQGSIRTNTEGHIDRFAQELERDGIKYQYRVDNKYGPDNLFSKLPIMKHMSNAVLYRSGEVKDLYFSSGTKQLFHESVIDGISVFSVHLPVLKHTRKKQIRELADVASKRDKVIVCGDFNNYWGIGELEYLQKHAGLEVHDPGPTNPSHRPSRHLDMFLTSGNLDVNRSKVIESTFSDHRPVMLEVNS